MSPFLRARAQRAVQVILPDGTRLSGGRASLFVLETIGWHPVLARLGQRRPLLWLVELGYRLVAANRDLFGRFLFRSEDESLARSAATRDEGTPPRR